MSSTGAFTECLSALPCWAAEDEFGANTLHLFFRFAVYSSVFANAADIILIIYVITDAAVWFQQ